MSVWELPFLHTLAPRDRRAVLLGLLVLLPALLWVVAVRPYRNRLSELNEQVASERALLQREQQLIARAATLPEALAAAERAASKAELRLVRAANIPLAEAEVSSYLESMAGLSRVLLQDMRGVELRRKETLPAEVRPIRLAVSGESDLIGVANFLHALETSPLLIRIREVTLEPVYDGGRTGTPTGVMQFAFTLEAFAPAESSSGEMTAPRAQTQPQPEVAQ